MSEEGWIGVDLDGTLAYYDEWRGEEHIGEPIIPMFNRIIMWLSQGINVKIFTARAVLGERQVKIIQDWCVAYGLPPLEVTATKDFTMIELWDDRCIQVTANTGERTRHEIQNQTD